MFLWVWRLYSRGYGLASEPAARERAGAGPVDLRQGANAASLGERPCGSAPRSGILPAIKQTPDSAAIFRRRCAFRWRSFHEQDFGNCRGRLPEPGRWPRRPWRIPPICWACSAIGRPFPRGTGSSLTCYALSKPRATQPGRQARRHLSDGVRLAGPQGQGRAADRPWLSVQGRRARQRWRSAADKFNFFARNNGKDGSAWLQQLPENGKPDRRHADRRLGGGQRHLSQRGTKTSDTYSPGGLQRRHGQDSRRLQHVMTSCTGKDVR